MSSGSAGSGLHGLTLAKMKTIVKQALGKTSFDSTFDLREVCNDALQLLVTAHAWTWREAALAVDTVADQAYVNLPTDFAEFVTDAHSSEDVIFGNMGKANLDDITRWRTTQLSGVASSTRYALTVVGGTTESDAPRYRLELWPTPNQVFPITGRYRRVIRKLVNDADVPDVPVAFHQLLRRILRAHAFEEDDQADAASRAWQRVNEMLPTLINLDGGAETNLGRMRGATAMQSELVRWTPNISIE
jgi:hypothetical protein